MGAYMSLAVVIVLCVLGGLGLVVKPRRVVEVPCSQPHCPLPHIDGVALHGLPEPVVPVAPAQRRSAGTVVSLRDLTPEQVDQLSLLVLEAHYREVLADPSKQKVWRRLLRDASAVRVVESIGR